MLKEVKLTTYKDYTLSHRLTHYNVFGYVYLFDPYKYFNKWPFKVIPVILISNRSN